MKQKIIAIMLWFDVGVKRYTTDFPQFITGTKLWFDVGVKRYTTKHLNPDMKNGCGLM